jgi:hypothetical protein
MDILDNKYVKAFLTTFILLYTPQIRPELPSYLKNLFNNPIFRIIILFLIVVKGNYDPSFALMLAILFVVISNCLSAQQARESFTNIKVKSKNSALI